MNVHLIRPALFVALLTLVSPLQAEDKKPELPKTEELLSIPAKITLNKEQKEMMAELRKKYEPELTKLDQEIASVAPDNQDPKTQIELFGNQEQRKKLVHDITRKKNGLLTEEQRKVLNITMPPWANQKALCDSKIWDLAQLEKLFTVQTRTYDPIEETITLVILSKGKWTDADRQADQNNWIGAKVQLMLFNKNEEKMHQALVSGHQITRSEMKLTEKQTEDGLVRYRIVIPLDRNWGSMRDAASIKIAYPEFKKKN